MKTKEAIRTLIDQGATVSVGYKRDKKSWYSEVKIYGESGYYSVSGEHAFEKFETADAAIDYFVEMALSSKNLGYVLTRLTRKGTLDIDDMESNWDKMKEDYDDEYKVIFDAAVKAEKKLINAENKTEEKEE